MLYKKQVVTTTCLMFKMFADLLRFCANQCVKTVAIAEGKCSTAPGGSLHRMIRIDEGERPAFDLIRVDTFKAELVAAYVAVVYVATPIDIACGGSVLSDRNIDIAAEGFTAGIAALVGSGP